MLLIQALTPYTAAMSIAKIISAIPYGYDSQTIVVEGDQNQGLPCFNIIGLPGRAIEESRDRIRSAIINSGFSFPHHKLIINLAPAELQKSGSYLDLAIALCILSLSQQLLASDSINSAFIGELALNGDLRPVRGIISIIEHLRKQGIKRLFIPAANASQAALVADDDMEIYATHKLREV